MRVSDDDLGNLIDQYEANTVEWHMVLDLRDAREWKQSALQVLKQWDDAYEAAKIPGQWGESKSACMLREFERLTTELARYKRMVEAVEGITGCGCGDKDCKADWVLGIIHRRMKRAAVEQECHTKTNQTEPATNVASPTTGV